MIIALALLQLRLAALAIEGMWLPLLLDSLNIKDMQEKGLRLSADDIYSINHASLKDAVVIFGGGCTGEVISPEGLLITNHHCGYSRIQSHSTVENNLLANGFWATEHKNELPNPGLTVTFLVRIEDVTTQVLRGFHDDMTEEERNMLIGSNAVIVANEAVRNSNYHAEIKPFYFGREYYLFVYETFRDVRLVGAPPEAIGRFGGDTDNWVWPRHTGDFSLFRIYADENNQPADYSPDNVPYKPKKYLPISVKGIREGDFTMVIGYPGNTDEYLLSTEIGMLVNKCLPAKVQMRTLKLTALEEEMNKSPEAKLRYSSKYLNISNYWKKWKGVIAGIRKSDVIEQKQKLETRFARWVTAMPQSERYSGLLDSLEAFYNRYEPVYTANDIASEMLGNIETFSLISRTWSLTDTWIDSTTSYRKRMAVNTINILRKYWQSNPLDIDRDILPEYLQIYADNTDAVFHPAFYAKIIENYNGDYKKYVDHLYKISVFTDSARLFKLLKKSSTVIEETMMTDPFYQIELQFRQELASLMYNRLRRLGLEKEALYRSYLSALMMMEPQKMFYPDANFTMRVTYGKVEGYEPADAIEYKYFTTLRGVMEKEDPEVEDYQVPAGLKDLYASKDYGPYTVDGQMPVCFIASNHTSGGNSGSPVLNAEGALIGINFDRNWEGTMSDYSYNPAICRNISLDVRYVLFIIDKIGGAQNLIDELTIVQ